MPGSLPADSMGFLELIRKKGGSSTVQATKIERLLPDPSDPEMAQLEK